MPRALRQLIADRAALFGLAVHMAGKNWFLDRMALLHDDMAAAGHPTPSPDSTVR